MDTRGGTSIDPRLETGFDPHGLEFEFAFEFEFEIDTVSL